ncbi:hypothetical protein B0T19DRAFT_98598 [Cercophora scortea]|uniref:Uncharacterized protein n=1 Tax=Cercophora scortea TaxID=314031 RepID=A0AAE0IVX6_9PEZI|nr:hypothetical protein B0T19DRAFT_98598 [Cercophora scortea]
MRPSSYPNSIDHDNREEEKRHCARRLFSGVRDTVLQPPEDLMKLCNVAHGLEMQPWQLKRTPRLLPISSNECQFEGEAHITGKLLKGNRDIECAQSNNAENIRCEEVRSREKALLVVGSMAHDEVVVCSDSLAEICATDQCDLSRTLTHDAAWTANSPAEQYGNSPGALRQKEQTNKAMHRKHVCCGWKRGSGAQLRKRAKDFTAQALPHHNAIDGSPTLILIAWSCFEVS